MLYDECDTSRKVHAANLCANFLCNSLLEWDRTVASSMGPIHNEGERSLYAGKYEINSEHGEIYIYFTQFFNCRPVGDAIEIALTYSECTVRGIYPSYIKVDGSRDDIDGATLARSLDEEFRSIDLEAHIRENYPEYFSPTVKDAPEKDGTYFSLPISSDGVKGFIFEFTGELLAEVQHRISAVRNPTSQDDVYLITYALYRDHADDTFVAYKSMTDTNVSTMLCTIDITDVIEFFGAGTLAKKLYRKYVCPDFNILKGDLI